MICIGIYNLVNRIKNSLHHFIEKNTVATDINKLNKMKLLVSNNLISYKRPKITKECIICHKKVSHNMNAKWSVLICGHKYHTKCILNFATTNTFCPTCVPELIINDNPNDNPNANSNIESISIQNFESNPMNIV
jgi:hypothetical protein